MSDSEHKNHDAKNKGVEERGEKYTTIHYHNYLQLDKLLSAQVLRSEAVGKPAHEEMLFIITHQAYELWFKQMKHELESVLKMFRADEVDERRISVAVSRLNRVEHIMKLLIKQIEILETMTPLDFLDFRAYLFPASGFQSYQFRMVEVLLGLPEQKRITYNNHHYASAFSDSQKADLEKVYREGTLFDTINGWLERTPFLQLGNFDFLKYYEKAVSSMVEKEGAAIKASDYLTEKEKEMRLQMLGNTNTYYQSVLNEEHHNDLMKKGELRLSYKASIAALFINLYREEPILQLPFQLLINLIDLDDLLTTWRYRHAQMVLRMLGKKIGTGGSSGHDYLNATAEKHHIFTDLHNISTLLIPRSELPELPAELKQQLGFYFGQLNS